MDYEKILRYRSEARAVYGTGSGTPALNTAQYSVVPVLEFRPTSPDFQAALYKDPTTGRYRIVMAGTNDLKGDIPADGALTSQSLLGKASSFVSAWHPEMTDALNEASPVQGADGQHKSYRVLTTELPPALTERLDPTAPVDEQAAMLGSQLSQPPGAGERLIDVDCDGLATSASNNQCWRLAA